VSRQNASWSFLPFVAVCALAAVASAGEPAKDDSTQLKTYSVGGTKSTPKEESSVAKVEKPKLETDLGIEKPTMGVIDMTPFTVTPVTVAPSAPTKAAPKPAAAAPVVAAPARPASNVAAPVGGGATPNLPAAAPARAAPSPAGTVPQAQGATAPTLTLVPLSTPAPDSPRDAMMAGTQGYVVVEFTINLEGGTQDITVVDASPQRTFDQAARRAVSRWKFQPLRENGQPVEKRVQRRIDFKL
jgi:protein TonB